MRIIDLLAMEVLKLETKQYIAGKGMDMVKKT